MGREIRKVPSDWEHPCYTVGDAPRVDMVDEYQPLHDEDYETASEQWIADFALWQRGEHPNQPCAYCRYFWEYDLPPDVEMHRSRKWTETEATHFQVYETVSEGTPVTPHFATKAELVDHLVQHGDSWDQDRGWDQEAATKFVESEWAPSLAIM